MLASKAPAIPTLRLSTMVPAVPHESRHFLLKYSTGTAGLPRWPRHHATGLCLAETLEFVFFQLKEVVVLDLSFWISIQNRRQIFRVKILTLSGTSEPDQTHDN